MSTTRKAAVGFLVLAIAVGAVLGLLVARSVFRDEARTADLSELAPELQDSQVFESDLNTIMRSFFEPVDETTLIEAANRGIQRLVAKGESEDKIVAKGITSMVDSLDDPFSAYMDKEQLASLDSQLAGSFSGVGIVMESIRNEVRVKGLLPGTPAAASGIQVGDVISEVDGVSTRHMTIEEVKDRIRGVAGTHVILGMRRANASQLVYFDLVRAAIDIQVLEQSMPVPGIGLISMADWTETIDSQLRQALLDLQGQGARGIILDLRGNPGGYFQQARQAADLFLRSGIIVTSKGRNGSQDYRADGDVLCDLPLVVLIDRGSASASEIFAGAMQDNARGVLVGETSFGKGSIQQVFRSSDGTALRLTIAKYLTPAGTNIDDEGIKPDVTVANPPLGDQDLQREKALEIMGNMIAGRPWQN